MKLETVTAGALPRLKQYSEFCYDKSVSIILEPAGDSFKFLQGTFVFNPKFSAYYESKNWEHWCATGTLRTTVLQHYHSYCESYHTQRFATLVGKLHEIDRFSYPDSNIGRGLCSIIPDFLAAEYPLRILTGAMKRMASTTNKGTWHRLRPAAAAAAYGRIKRLFRSNDVPTTKHHQMERTHRQNP